MRVSPINGALSSMPALSARFYPTQCRATGVSWMTPVLGVLVRYLVAWIGAVLLGNDWSFTAILSLLLIQRPLLLLRYLLNQLLCAYRCNLIEVYHNE